MKNLFDGLFLYEIILLILGSLLFLVLLGGLISYIYRKETIKWQYLATFVLPVIMIAYPSIKKIEVDNGRLTIEKLNEAIEQGLVVTDAPVKKEMPKAEIKNQLEKTVAEIEERPAITEESKVEIGRAHFNLGHDKKAEKILDEVLEMNPKNKKAVNIKQKLKVKKLEVSR